MKPLTILEIFVLGFVASVVIWLVVGPGYKALLSGLRGEPDEIKLSKWLGFCCVTYHGQTDLYFPWQRVPPDVLKQILEAAAFQRKGERSSPQLEKRV